LALAFSNVWVRRGWHCNAFRAAFMPQGRWGADLSSPRLAAVARHNWNGISLVQPIDDRDAGQHEPHSAHLVQKARRRVEAVGPDRLVHSHKLANPERIRHEGEVGRSASLRPEKYLSVGLDRDDLAALKDFMAREGFSSQSEAARAILRRYWQEHGFRQPTKPETGGDE
jgi:hypothetical protein